MTKTFEQLKKEFGTVSHNGIELAISQVAYCDNYGTDGEVRYYASAEDQEGNEYQVAWDTTAKWDEAGELYNLELKQEQRPESFDDEDQERMDELMADGVHSYLIEDESNACDWDNPVSIEEN